MYCKRRKVVTRTISSKTIDKGLIDYFNNFDFSLNFSEEQQKPLKRKDFNKEYIKLENKRKKLQKAWFNELITDEELKEHQTQIDFAYKELKKEEENILDFKNKFKFQKKIQDICINFSEVITKLSDEQKVDFLNSFIDSVDIELANIRDFSTEKLTRIKVDVVVKRINFKV